MGFNYGREKKKFDTDWKKKSAWYRAAGMSEDAIHTLHAFDWEQFKSERRYANHTQELPSDEVLEWMSYRVHNIYASVQTDMSDDCLSARHDWIEQLDTPMLVRQLRRLSQEDIELLTLLLDGYTQREIAGILGCTQPNIAQKMRRIKKVLKNF